LIRRAVDEETRALACHNEVGQQATRRRHEDLVRSKSRIAYVFQVLLEFEKKKGNRIFVISMAF
jgi:hypothetical protein